MRATALTAVLLAAAATTPLERFEADYADYAELKAQVAVTRARGAERNLAGTALAELQAREARLREALARRLPALPVPSGAEDARALAAMRRAIQESDGEDAPEADAAPDCSYDPEALARGAGGLGALRRRLYACFGAAARSLKVDGETLDRLTILGRLGESGDPAERRRLFLALDPLWRTANGDGGARSPYRKLIALGAAARPNSPYLEARARELGLEPRALEQALVAILEAWRDAAAPVAALEPWDYWHANEAASRRLSPRIPLGRLRELNDRYYRSLGADPSALGIHYDLDPRPGKTPVAFTDFGAAARRRDTGWSRGEFWVFATYRSGGLGNLVELLHETGHGIHIAAIRTRPAFASWPDSDPFTEALADVPALEAYEPGWQREYLGDAASLADSLRSKYGSIVLDVAWALFEVRLQREPDADPNRVWTELTRDYLRIVPHPELSWWALRGQLLESPGYMTNYAIGAILAADMRARCAAERGAFWKGDAGYYAWLSERLLRFGQERPARDVLAGFLDRPPTAAALLDDLGRARGHATGR